MKTTWGEINSRVDTSEEKRNEFEDIAIVSIQNEMQGEKRLGKKMIRASLICGTNSVGLCICN